MLKKLFKYDFEATCRIFLVLHSIIAVVTILGKIVFTLVPEGLENAPLLSTLIPTYILLIIGLFAGFRIFLIVRFYRSLFTDEGYLYHTLPVKPWQLIASKLFVNVILSLLGTLILILCGLILLAGGTMESIMANRVEITELIQVLFGVTPTGLLIFLLFYAPITECYSFLMFFASIALGQVILPKHKVLGAFVAYMIYYVAIQTISAIPIFACTFATIQNANIETALFGWVTDFYHFVYFFSLALSAIAGTVFFLITDFIMKKKLNLD